MTTQFTQYHSSFQQLNSGLGFGVAAPHNWHPLKTQPLLIFVGLTGVGKTTTLSALLENTLDYTLLPNRRILTNEIIIPQMAGKEQDLQTMCRLQRFQYTRQYREMYPGGMAYVLTQLWVNLQQFKKRLIFDGLRGENEVIYAAENLPRAHFVVLDAPNKVRLERLLNRQDAFDKVKQNSEQLGVHLNQLKSFAALGMPEASSLFSLAEEQELLNLVRAGLVTQTELKDKLKIILKEQKNYNPKATRLALQKIAPERTLVVDTSRSNPQQVADKILSSLAVAV